MNNFILLTGSDGEGLRLSVERIMGYRPEGKGTRVFMSDGHFYPEVLEEPSRIDELIARAGGEVVGNEGASGDDGWFRYPDIKPPEAHEYNVFCDYGHEIAFWSGGHWYTKAIQSTVKDVTHWRPVPPEPQVAEAKAAPE